MNLPTEIFGRVVVVHTLEELSGDKGENLESFLTSLERSQVIVDLDGTETIDSEGLTSLLNAQETLRHCEGDLKIATAYVMPLGGDRAEEAMEALIRNRHELRKISRDDSGFSPAASAFWSAL